MSEQKKYFDKCNTTDQVKKEYLRLAKKYHPDKNKSPDATAVFQDIHAQMEKRVRELGRAEGKSDLDIEKLFESFGSKDFMSNAMEATNFFKQMIEDEGEIDLTKPPDAKTFGKVFNKVFAVLSGEVESKEKKKLPGK